MPTPSSESSSPDPLVDELRDELRSKSGQQWGVVSTGSMAPLLNPGDRVLAEVCSDASVGQIVLFRRRGELTTHRVVTRRGDRCLEKGDRNPRGEWLTHDQILGRVTRVEKPAGTLLLDSTGLSARWVAWLSVWEHRLRGDSSRPAGRIRSRLARLFQELALASARRHIRRKLRTES